jgi:hypothetical protein
MPTMKHGPVRPACRFMEQRSLPMHDFRDEFLPRLTTPKLAGLDLGVETIQPSYEGQSLLNFPASLCRWFGAPALPHHPLDIPRLDDLAESARQIVVILIDAVSLERFCRWIERTDTDFLSLLNEACLFPITSTAPSTTSAALTTLWTGRSPAEHGILGYELFLKEYGLVANMISHSPASFEGRSGLLYQAGFDPERALPVPTLGPHLSNAQIEVFALLSKSIYNSGLSRMHYPSVQMYGFRTTSDLWIQARQLAELRLDRPRLIWIYHGDVDTCSHLHGPDSEQAETEFLSFLNILYRAFLSRLSPTTRRQTLLLLLADHGQISTAKNPHFDLNNHPGLVNRLHLLPTGESRFTYLYPRPGQLEAVTEYFELTWPGMFRLLPSQKALEMGLFGPGKPAQVTHSRIGDTISIAMRDSYLWWSPKPNPLLGRHGGLSDQEMLVPLFAMRLE